MLKKITTGIVAHVDAGKTTLSEGLLYLAGSIRTLGKVDRKDAFLDTNKLERARGITIFSKQAGFVWDDTKIMLLDTPGHVDFSAEMERVLSVLDYAILVISGADGVQGHTRTLWDLLKTYDVPVFLFVNKTDQPGTDRGCLMKELKTQLDSACVDFTGVLPGTVPDARCTDSVQTGKKDSAVKLETPDEIVCDERTVEDIAACDETVMESYFERGVVTKSQVQQMIWERKLFPCYFGSALKLTGVKEFMNGFTRFTLSKVYPADFGARVFKITRDPQGNRLTHMKITGGSVSVRETLSNRRLLSDAKEDIWEEKISQIRIYNGDKFEAVPEACAGDICAAAGLTKTFPGQGFGFESETGAPVLEPVLSRKIILPEGMDAGVMLPKLRMLEEEQPELHIVWDERLQEIRVQVMGEVQVEILSSLIADRFGAEVSFGPADIVYKETILKSVEGVGHFEPLRHYAEVHLLMEPLAAGSGLEFATECSEDLLDKNWQRLILTHLGEKTHCGVLTGSAITDMRITLIAGRAHAKHTEGGDFRKATYRAVRQGLMEAESRLLEPYYNFRLEIPEQAVGRAMHDIEKMHGHFEPPEREGGNCILTGYAPVVTMQDYKQEVSAYTKGFGHLSFSLRGYEACHNEEEVIAAHNYDPEADVRNTPDSVFCAHGSGFIVPWYEVKEYMHVESPLSDHTESLRQEADNARRQARTVSDVWLGTEEVDAILEQATYANRGKSSASRKGVVRRGRADRSGDPFNKSFRQEENSSLAGKTPDGKEEIRSKKKSSDRETAKEEYLLVDGYNILFAWEDLSGLAHTNLDSARGKLLDELCSYQAMKDVNLIVVFDAYRVAGHATECLDYHNIHVVYTKEAETADQYIEKFAHTNAKKYAVTVATSDGLEQIIIRGEGCRLLSARDLKEEVERTKQFVREVYMDNNTFGSREEFRNAVAEAVLQNKSED